MSTERERWNTLSQLDMGYSLDADQNNEKVIEDVILDDEEFLKASHGLFNRTDYMLAKAEVEMAYAVSDSPSEELIKRLIEAKSNVTRYIENTRIKTESLQ